MVVQEQFPGIVAEILYNGEKRLKRTLEARNDAIAIFKRKSSVSGDIFQFRPQVAYKNKLDFRCLMTFVLKSE